MRKLGFFEKNARDIYERLSVKHAKSYECFVRFASKQQPFIFGRATELFGTELFDPKKGCGGEFFGIPKFSPQL
jgi:hypothetical protein